MSKKYIVACETDNDKLASYSFYTGYFRGKGYEFKHIPSRYFIDILGTGISVMFMSKTDSVEFRSDSDDIQIVRSFDAKAMSNMLEKINKEAMVLNV